MKYEFMSRHSSEFGVQQMCRALEVRRSGYYAWRQRPESQREQNNRELLRHIRHEFQLSRKTYGSPRIQAALRRKGIACGRHRVAKLMRFEGLVARKRRKYHPESTHRQPGAIPAPNLLNQDFTASAPNTKWVTDITYINTAEGWLYLASILDLYSRRVVGWAMADHQRTSLVEDALNMAIARRRPLPGLIHHSDQGCQYTSAAYQFQLLDLHSQPSMSRVGNCYDNAAMESFFATIKAECADHPFPSRNQARRAIFEYIEVWYNRQRLHSALGYLSPAEFELKPGK